MKGGKMKNVFVAMLSLVLLSCAGCIPTAAQIQITTDKVDELMVAIDELQASDVEIDAKVSSEIDKVQEDMAKVNAAIKEAKDKPLLEGAVDVVKATEQWNPYAKQMTMGLGIANALLGLFAVKKYKDGKDDSNAFGELVIAIDSIKKNPTAISDILNAESPATRAKVANIRKV